MYVRELRVRYCRRRVTAHSAPLPDVSSPAEAGAAFMRLLGHEPVEVCGVLCLSTRNTLLAYHELSRGTIGETLVHPRELFKVALLANAAAVIIGHNHPSGDPPPTNDDAVLTARLRTASQIVGIGFLDHIVIGDGRYVSFRDSGQL